MRRGLALLAIAALAACQTVPAKPGFSAKQVAALTQEEFKPVGDNYELGLSDRVLFEVNRSELAPEAAERIGKLAGVLKSVDINGAGVEGHTDSTGSDQYNQQLSERRAATVKAEFVKAGMPEANVRAVGKGEAQPIASNDTDDGRAQNRRVVIVVTPADAN
ncbi:MAG: cell envelope biogenesis protein OmpA [Novosphingobium sp.]|nr:cell envelope biogenesis protein OmpA [Novosphingobium sp.]